MTSSLHHSKPFQTISSQYIYKCSSNIVYKQTMLPNLTPTCHISLPIQALNHTTVHPVWMIETPKTCKIQVISQVNYRKLSHLDKRTFTNLHNWVPIHSFYLYHILFITYISNFICYAAHFRNSTSTTKYQTHRIMYFVLFQHYFVNF